MKTDSNKPIEVTVIVPCLNEENTIRLLLNAINRQTYPREKMEVVICDAFSTDRTREKVRQFAEDHPELAIRILDNERRTIPAAINTAAEAARGEYLVRMDAHSIPNEKYIEVSLEILKSGIAENVGGIWEIHPGSDTCISRSIAKTVSHPLGAGDAKYRISLKSEYADTVPFGAFRKDQFLSLGGFDESLRANEDYEFNTRLRKSGGRIWLDTRIRSVYYARQNIKELACQYWRYGFWKFKMLCRHPSSLQFRQALPPIFLSMILLLAVLSFFVPFARIILGAGLSFYLLILISASLAEVVKKRDICLMNMTIAFMVVHFSWGGGFLFSLFRSLFINNY